MFARVPVKPSLRINEPFRHSRHSTEMPPGIISLTLVLLAALPVWCFVDECDSLDAKGLRTQTHNITLNFSVVEPIVDPFRFSRDVSDDGFVQYVSPVGFESVTIIGYAYNNGIVDTDWQFELRTGEQRGDRLRRVRFLNASNLELHRVDWKNQGHIETNWTKFRIDLPKLPRCPKVSAHCCPWCCPQSSVCVGHRALVSRCSDGEFLSWMGVTSGSRSARGESLSVLRHS